MENSKDGIARGICGDLICPDREELSRHEREQVTESIIEELNRERLQWRRAAALHQRLSDRLQAMLSQVRKENAAVVRVLDEMEKVNPRAMGLLSRKEKFICVAVDEPYFKAVYEMIRQDQIKKGKWDAGDQGWYVGALKENAQTLREKEKANESKIHPEV